MKFTHEKPTVRGWYLYWNYHALEPFCVECRVFDGVMWARVEQPVSQMNGEWSERLVPVGEVETAYREGASDYEVVGGCWTNSRARRVVEGKEEM